MTGTVGSGPLLTGYSDRLSVARGERIEFKVNSETDYELRIVRLLQGDDTEAGPGYLEQEVEAACAGTYPARVQRTEPGSHVVVHDETMAQPACGVTLLAWVWPTLPEAGRQAVLTRWAADGTGYGLELVDGTAVFSVRDAERVLEVRAAGQLTREWWHLLAAGYDAESGRAFVWQVPRGPSGLLDLGAATEICGETVSLPAESAGPLVIAGAAAGDSMAAHFNGRISAPRWFGRALDRAEVARVADGDELGALKEALLGAWDLSPAQPSSLVVDRSGGGRHGSTVNAPARAVRGHLWDGSAQRPSDAPAHYDCMHFHNDDLSDAGWETTVAYEIPAGLPSGVYAARLRASGQEDYLPFVVQPGREPTARALFVLPTLTYIAYGNEHFYNAPFVNWSRASDRPLRLAPNDLKIQQHPEFGHSLYDVHSDGSYTMYSSRLRPILNFRPKIVAYWNWAGRHFCADLYMLGWLHREGFPVDVVTDEDVHRDGRELLDRYQVVITGSHPEYTTERMLNAFTQYTAGGGRVMYLGGNGFWWVTTIDPAAPHLIEVRKQAGITMRGVGVPPGEAHHSHDGTAGGSWRACGRGPETWLGVGFASQGFAAATSYHRSEASYDPELAWIFDGVDGEEIGSHGLGLGGAAGDEIDAANEGSPPHTVVLASSRGHHERYVALVNLYPHPETIERARRSDITYTPTGNGGAIFAAGSMSWYPSLAYNNYDNDVARVTRNVLTRFLCAGPDRAEGAV